MNQAPRPPLLQIRTRALDGTANNNTVATVQAVVS